MLSLVISVMSLVFTPLRLRSAYASAIGPFARITEGPLASVQRSQVFCILCKTCKDLLTTSSTPSHTSVFSLLEISVTVQRYKLRRTYKIRVRNLLEDSSGGRCLLLLRRDCQACK